MTYRRLYLHLLVSGAFLLAGLWLYSFRTANGFLLILPGGMPVSGGALGSVHCGTASIQFFYGGGGGSGLFEFKSAPVVLMRPEYQYGVMGKFGISRIPVQHASALTVLIPLWLVYLLLAAAGFFLMRWGEKRSAASAEKALALENHSGEESPTP